ncbi:MAG: hypothetical protein ACAI44_34745 [Candidatus Sericytochromatia bacterium]
MSHDKKIRASSWFVPQQVLALLILLTCGCQGPQPGPVPVSRQAADKLTVASAKALRRIADREAGAWSARSTLVQLDAWNISLNGLNDHPFDAIWKFYYLRPGNQATTLAVIFNSRYDEPIVQEESINQVFTSTEIADLWVLDSPEAMKLAHERGIQWFPVQRLRLNQPDQVLIWQFRDSSAYVALDARTGAAVPKPKAAL